MTTKAQPSTALIDSTDYESYRKAGGQVDSHANQRIRSKLVEREVVHCVSSLVSHFAQNDGALEGSDYSYDDVHDLCTRRYDHADKIEELNDEIETWENSIVDLETEVEDARGRKLAKIQADLTAARATVNELTTRREELQEEQDGDGDEVYEHWAVTTWFAEKLKEHGETTGELFDLTIWGRTCTGQAIAMDCVIAEIAASMQILDGQRNSWAD